MLIKSGYLKCLQTLMVMHQVFAAVLQGSAASLQCSEFKLVHATINARQAYHLQIDLI